MANGLKYNPLQAQLLEFPRLQVEPYRENLLQFAHLYFTILQEQKIDVTPYMDLFSTYFSAIDLQLVQPYRFESYHQRLREPLDYTNFGLDMFRPLVDTTHSELRGTETLDWIQERLAQKENVFLMGNHQIEAEPQVLRLMLESRYADIAKDWIFVAGERVITDPLAVPFSLGCNLFCIYSKKYFESRAAQKEVMISHNRSTIQAIKHQLDAGGKCIYVAPSGGRDRYNAEGHLLPAPFDQRSVDLMTLLGKRSRSKTHYCPLALYTYPILPPPADVRTAIGEERIAHKAPIYVHFGTPLPLETYSPQIRTNLLYTSVKKYYTAFPIEA